MISVSIEKISLTICSLIFVLTAWGQSNREYQEFIQSLKKKERKYIQRTEECRTTIMDAVDDFDNGMGKYFVIGDLSIQEVVYFECMDSMLNIKLEMLGCSPIYFEQCYNLYSDFKLKQIYGDDVFDGIRRVAEKIQVENKN